MSRRDNAWFDEEIEFIENAVGKMSGHEICDAINQIRARYKVKPRTIDSVWCMINSLGLSLERENLYSASQLAKIFGVTYISIGNWRKLGWLVGRKWDNFTVYDEDAIIQFAQNYAWAFDLKHMPNGKFKTAAELANRRDPWLTLRDVSRIVNITDKTIAKYVRRHNIPHQTRPFHNGQMFVRASTIQLIQDCFPKSRMKKAA